MNSKEMVKIAYEALSDKKGQDIKIIDIQSVSDVYKRQAERRQDLIYRIPYRQCGLL